MQKTCIATIKERGLKIGLVFIFCFFGCFVFSQYKQYLPTKSNSNNQVVKHTYYTLSYSEPHEQAEWVYYVLTPKMLLGNVNRTNDFREDLKISTGSAQLKDYKNSGYDKGHLVPANDMRMNNLSMSESFYMSNMSPQFPSFNRGIWKRLETLVNSWAKKTKIYIVTGGVLTSELSEIGINGVSVPKYFYKVIYDSNNNKMIAFVFTK